MATPITTDTGEEYVWTGQADGDTITLILFNDATDGLAESDDLAAVTTEPDTADDYARQTTTISTSQLAGSGGGDFGFSNDASVTFTLGTNSETIDAVGYVANFTSSVAGDGSATDHLIAADALNQSYDLSQFDSFELTYEAGDLEHVATNGGA